MSFPGTKRLGIDFTATSTSADHKLGEVAWSNTGQRYRYVKAGEAIAVYQPVDWVAAYTASVTDAGDPILGVAQTAIASGSYGWVLESGVGVLLMEASQAACHFGVITEAGGLAQIADVTVVGDYVRGISYATEASTPAGVAVFLI